MRMGHGRCHDSWAVCRRRNMDIAYARAGHGEPLVLLHALGADRHSWDPVLDGLTDSFDVIAIDRPGFGESPPLSGEPSPAALARRIAEFLTSIGVTRPHLVGNSLGGWIGLELAAIQPVASLTLLAPAGLWRGRTPLYDRVTLRITRWLTSRAGGLLSWSVRYRPFRVLILGQTHGRPGRVTPDYARAAIRSLGTSPGFDDTLAATRDRHYAATTPLGAPVTVAYGSRDLVILKGARRLDELPSDTRLIRLPGCGHLSMSDDPAAVIGLITAATAPNPAVRRTSRQ
jgi:pimeloyl-ACP methyl ester carboxylesterase